MPGNCVLATAGIAESALIVLLDRSTRCNGSCFCFVVFLFPRDVRMCFFLHFCLPYDMMCSVNVNNQKHDEN